MILNRLFKGVVILSLCVANVSLSSCAKNEANGGTKPSDCKPGEDFYSFANAEWLESIKDADPQGYYGWGHDIDAETQEQVEAIKENMPAYKTLYQGVANRKKNFDASVQFVIDFVQGMFDEVETKEEAYVAYGKAIRMGIPSAATLLTGVCQEDNTIGYYFMPPIIGNPSLTGLHRECTPNQHHQPIKKYKRYVPNTRSGKSTLDYILEGIGLDPRYYLKSEITDQVVASLEQMSLMDLAQSTAEAIQIELLIYCSDEYAKTYSGGVVESVKQCIDEYIEQDLGYFTSYYFCKQYPTDKSEAAFSALGADLAASFRARLENNQWLSPSTQQAAIEKLDCMKMLYGAPKTWPVTEMPKLEGKLLVTDVLKVKEHRYDVIKSILGKDFKENLSIYYMFFDYEQKVFSYVANAFYEPTGNTFIVMPPFMLEPAYSADMDESRFYGILGSAIGHEITHGFDRDGAAYDKDGKLNNWWTAEDLAKFTELNKRVIENVGRYDVVPGIKTNSETTVTEDVADLGGINIAYDLWVKKLTERGVTGDELIEQKKNFFIGYAVMQSSKIPVEELIEDNGKEVHSAAHIRVNSVVQQIDDWYELFNIVEGDALYIAPEKRITIW